MDRGEEGEEAPAVRCPSHPCRTLRANASLSLQPRPCTGLNLVPALPCLHLTVFPLETREAILLKVSSPGTQWPALHKYRRNILVLLHHNIFPINQQKISYWNSIFKPKTNQGQPFSKFRAK